MKALNSNRPAHIVSAALVIAVLLITAVPLITHASCSSGFLGWVETCNNSSTRGDGCIVTTQQKCKGWGWFKSCHTISDTYCPPTAIVESSVHSNALGDTLSCPAAYPQLCGNTSCIPAGAVCCSAVGHADLYCNAGSFCTTSGQCEASTGGLHCVASYNNSCSAAANSCGMSNNGFYSCTGACQAVTPADSSCPTPSITLTRTPLFVNPHETCQVNWQTSNTTSCTLTDLTTGLQVSSGLSGSYTTPQITAMRNYRLACKNGTVVSSHSDVACQLNPAFQEQ